MPRFPSLPDNPHLSDVFRRFPAGMWQLCDLHDVKLRGDSPLSVAERELIAAYVSGLNACRFCFGAHSSIAEIHGMDPGLFEKLVESPTEAGVDRKLLPILAYVKKLTESPSKLVDRDAEAVFAEGWSEQALFDAVVVCALFNFMNRIVEGCGVVPTAAMTGQLRAMMEQMKGDPDTYKSFARMSGVPAS
ncbi:MAG: carboxymuconolactone decarboxylase family protein [Myxococcota bacterium]